MSKMYVMQFQDEENPLRDEVITRCRCHPLEHVQLLMDHSTAPQHVCYDYATSRIIAEHAQQGTEAFSRRQREDAAAKMMRKADTLRGTSQSHALVPMEMVRKHMRNQQQERNLEVWAKKWGLE